MWCSRLGCGFSEKQSGRLHHTEQTGALTRSCGSRRCEVSAPRLMTTRYRALALHLELPPSQSGVQGSYTLRALKIGAACRNAMRDSAILNAKPFGVAEGNCPDVSSLEDSHVAVTSMPQKKVAGVGSAPTSADFQPAAHLSEPSSVWIKWSLGVVTLHGLSVINRMLCC